MESLKILQELFDLLALGYEMCRTNETIDIYRAVMTECWQEIFQVYYPDDIVDILTLDRNTGISFYDEGIEMILEIFSDIYRVDTA